MSINRHNYEEYFILYMDNELSSTERRMVEAFVQNHPDLKDELDILSQSKLAPDNNIVFENKEELIKMSNSSSINLANYEEWLTLYIDNELTGEQKSEVEKFVAAYPQAKNELSLLQKAKLQAEEIIFPYKESLYRRADKVRVVQMRWFRVAAAAVLFIAFSVAAVFVYNNKKQKTIGLVESTPGKDNQNTTGQNTSKNNSDNKQSDKPVIAPPVNESATAQTKEQKTKQVYDKPDNKNITVVKNELPKKLPVKKEEQLIANNENHQSSNNSPQLYNNSEETMRVPNKTPVKLYNTEVSDLTTTNIIKTASFVTPDASLTSDSKQENTSGGLRGFLRKITRTIEKRTGIKPANDDDQILIGGLAVKLN